MSKVEPNRDDAGETRQSGAPSFWLCRPETSSESEVTPSSGHVHPQNDSVDRGAAVEVKNDDDDGDRIIEMIHRTPPRPEQETDEAGEIKNDDVEEDMLHMSRLLSDGPDISYVLHRVHKPNIFQRVVSALERISSYETLTFLPGFFKPIPYVLRVPLTLSTCAVVFTAWLVKRWLNILINIVPTARHVIALVARLIMAGKISILLYVSAILVAQYADEATDVLILVQWFNQARRGELPWGYFIVGMIGFIMPIILTLGVLHYRTNRGLTEDVLFSVICEIELLQESLAELESAAAKQDAEEMLIDDDNDGDNDEDRPALFYVAQGRGLPAKKVTLPKMELLKLLEATESVVMAHLQSMTMLRVWRRQGSSMTSLLTSNWFEMVSLATSVMSIGLAVGTVRCEADVHDSEAKQGKLVRLAALTVLSSAESLLRLGTLISWKRTIFGAAMMFAFPWICQIAISFFRRWWRTERGVLVYENDF